MQQTVYTRPIIHSFPTSVHNVLESCADTGYRKQLLLLLEGEVISEKYVLEYGTDCLEMRVGAIERSGERVATGGTLCAAIRLLGT
jgi:hypothetical protein